MDTGSTYLLGQKVRAVSIRLHSLFHVPEWVVDVCELPEAAEQEEEEKRVTHMQTNKGVSRRR